jgi:hypothetical protein
MLSNKLASFVYHVEMLPKRIHMFFRFAKQGIFLGRNPKAFLPGVSFSQKEIDVRDIDGYVPYTLITIRKNGIIVKQVKSVAPLSFGGFECLDWPPIAKLL